MHDLATALDIVRDRIKKHGSKCAKNEMMTRYALIDPLLRALGWDVSDPGTVVPEDTGSDGTTDYTMSGNSMLIEAKKFNESLDKHVKRLVDYIKTRNVRYGVLTNGGRWRVYDSKQTTRTPVVEFDVNDADGIIIPKVVMLYHSVVLASLPEKPVSEPKPNGDGGSDENILHIVPLTKIDFQKEKNPPIQVSWNDTTEIIMKGWADVLVCITRYLVVDHGGLTAANCPVMSGSMRAILNTSPTNPNGKKFRSEQVGKLFLNKHGDRKTVIRKACKLAEAASLDPDFFTVGFSRLKG